MSMYAPVYDGDTPIGYVGAGTFVNNIAVQFTDVSSFGVSSAYVYFVDHREQCFIIQMKLRSVIL